MPPMCGLPTAGLESLSGYMICVNKEFGAEPRMRLDARFVCANYGKRELYSVQVTI